MRRIDKLDGDIKQRIVDARDRGRLAVFFGAGVSREAGFPGWRGLTTQLMEAFKRDPTMTEAVVRGYSAIPSEWSLDILDVIKDTKRPYLLDQYRKIFPQSREAYTPTSLGRKLANLNVARYVTLNYDFCFQASLRTQGMTSYQEMSLKTLNVDVFDAATSPLVCQIHGNASESIDDIILTMSQYNSAYRSGGPLYKFLDHVFKNYALVIVGYGFNDSRINELLSYGNAYSPTPSQYVRVGIQGYSKDTEIRADTFRDISRNRWNVNIIDYGINQDHRREDHSAISNVLELIGETVGLRYPSAPFEMNTMLDVSPGNNAMDSI